MSSVAFSSGVTAPRKALVGSQRRAVAARAGAPQVGRREAVFAVAAALVTLTPKRADAILGIGRDPAEIYTEETTSLLSEINRVVALSPEDNKEQAVVDLKKQMNEWTSKYRTSGKFGGRPSFSNLYSAVNALAGHWNSFGADAPVPKKRYARIAKELEDVDKLLKRGR